MQHIMELRYAMVPEHMRGMILSTPEVRVKLLRAGFIGKEIEQLYVNLNSFELVIVDWDDEVDYLRRAAHRSWSNCQPEKGN